MDSIEEKRVYGDREGAITAYVASAMGVVRVRVAGDTVGEFGFCDRCTARDVAATRDAVAIATDEDVRVCSLADATGTDAEETFDETGFGPAVAVGYDADGDLLAAAPDGRVACRAAGSDEWTTLADETVAPVRAIDGDLIGTDDGVYRVQDGRLDHAGLTDVRDVSAAGAPLAATAEGLYKLGNGWMECLDGAFVTVAADPRSQPGRIERAHAVTDGTVYEYAPDADVDGDSEWRDADGYQASERIVGFGYGDEVYAVAEDGTFLAASDDGWRTQTLGVTDVAGMAVPATMPANENE
ncbi:HVO_0234 family beta-propeller protein [Natrinema salifodinae]|uniref:HVO-0234-like beta-propeller domain-containing protein n=1 Tax=Natrinema salifodinae TaxID=1202768 RepID=A0A1I0QI43_9EURY|nr:hypothetical protein [Natrinema salifodinae]SEW26836.1 hypothetical protein SAMN05216285_3618 [Natrinema salifodinae]